MQFLFLCMYFMYCSFVSSIKSFIMNESACIMLLPDLGPGPCPREWAKV